MKIFEALKVVLDKHYYDVPDGIQPYLPYNKTWCILYDFGFKRTWSSNWGSVIVSFAPTTDWVLRNGDKILMTAILDASRLQVADVKGNKMDWNVKAS